MIRFLVFTMPFQSLFKAMLRLLSYIHNREDIMKKNLKRVL